MLQIKKISKSFGEKTVLKDISISIEDNSIYGLIGKNGAGKTTLLSIIAGLCKPSNGCYITKKDDVNNIAFLPDVPQYFDYMTCEEYIDFLFMKNDRDTVKKRNELLELVGLSNKIKIKTMSRGMKQRLGIAAVLVSNPDVILLDEPTSALDPAGRFELMEILKKLKQEGKTIILSSHILSDMEKICDKVGFLHDGVIKKEIIPSQIFSNVLELVITVDTPIKKQELTIDDYTINKIDDYTFEIKSKNTKENNLNMQSKLFDALAKIDYQIVNIKALNPTLDNIFQEVCR